MKIKYNTNNEERQNSKNSYHLRGLKKRIIARIADYIFLCFFKHLFKFVNQL